MKIFKYNILVFIAAILFCSCTKWLDVDLVNETTEEELFSSKTGYYDALAGAYNGMSTSSLYGQKLSFEFLEILTQTYVYADLESDYPQLRDYNYEDATVKSQIDAIWYNCYKIISQVNNVIKHAKNSDILTERDKNQILGEALAIRAYMHFDLIRMFCSDVKKSPKGEGIPYNKEFGVSVAPVYNVEECVQLVLNDLLEAEGMLMKSDKILDIVPYELGYTEGTTEIILKDKVDVYVARMNYYAVKALLARVSLARGDNKSAREYADEVINSEKFRLLDRKIQIEISKEKMDMLFSDEHIFSLRNVAITKNSEGLHKDVVAEGSTKGAKLKLISMYNIYDCGVEDVRYDKWTDMGFLRKFSSNNADYYYPKVPLIKLSEMYLIAAEAYWKVDADKSLVYLNTLRKSRIKGYSSWNYVDEKDIFNEIRREFVGEGQMFFQYKRLDHDIIRDNGDGDIIANDNVFVFPIPDNEIEIAHRK